MPKSRLRSPVILELVKQLLAGALGWSSAELELAKLDARSLLRRYIFAIGLLFASFAILTAAVFTLAETLIGALADYVHGHLIAGLIVSMGLLAIVAVMIAVAYASITKSPTPQGVVFRRLLGRDTE